MSGMYKHKEASTRKVIANRQFPELPDSLLEECLHPFGVTLHPDLAAAIRAYVQLLLHWNDRMNLTSVTEPAEILRRHFGESMFAVHTLNMASGSLVDIGSGAGFPGLAVKLAAPDLDVTFIEASLRKSAFLTEVIRTLKLAKARVVSKRIEQLEELRGSADYVTCRAVRPDKRLLGWSAGTLKPTGSLVLWLGEADAHNVVKTVGWSWHESIRIPHSKSRVLLVGSPTSG